MSTKVVEDIYPFSPLQEGMLFHSLFAPRSGVYCTQFACTVELSDLAAFERAWQEAVERHAVLRTAFAWENLKRPLQVVGRNIKLSPEHFDWRGLSEQEKVQKLEEYLKAERGRGFVLSKAPLMRLAFMRLAEHTFYFVWNIHHMLLDGWSMALLISEVFSFYEAFQKLETIQLPQPRAYRDYIDWVQRQDPMRAETFWREKLAGFTVPTPLGIDEAPGSLLSEKDVYNTEQLQLTKPVSAALQKFARENGLTVNTLAQGAWALLLSRYSGQQEVLFGVTVSGRSGKLTGIESMVGLFINCLPARMCVPPEARVLPWLRTIQEQQVELREFEFSTLAETQRWSSVPAGVPLFESFLVFENYPVDSSIDKQAKSLGLRDIRDVAYTNVPLHIRVLPGQNILLQTTYDSRRFHASSIKRMLEQFQSFFESILADPAQKLSALPPTPESERRRYSIPEYRVRLLKSYVEFKQEDVEQSIASRFDSQVAKYSDKRAVVTKDCELTYEELNALANQCANRLLALPNAVERVALLFPHDASMVVAILGALKAGMTYVPIDPSHPAERNSLIVSDAQIGAVLTGTPNLGRARELMSAVPVIDMEDNASNGNTANPGLFVSPDTPAYILYTSGTTGRPKGVIQNNRNVLHHIRCYVNGLRIGVGDRLTLFSSYSFDAAVMDMFGALLSGATLYPYSIPEEGISNLPDWLIQNEISIYHSTPTVYRYFIRSLAGGEEFPNLRIVDFGGEESHRNDFELYKDTFSPNCILVNGSGPTESTMSLQFFLDKRTEVNGQSLPLGYPVEQTEILLLDEEGKQSTLYGPGEIGIRSRYLALRYWQRPDLTASAFLNDPDDAQMRIYRTGDMARVLHNGNIEFIGRKDSQVKIRGVRVELGEIEARLNSYASVAESAVVALERTTDEKFLVAYIVGDTQKPSSDELRAYLRQFLPEYMVPTSFVWLEKLPLTPGGKIDRASLPVPELSGGESAVRPRTALEQTLVNIWEQVLGVEHIGLNDNFFDLGGHSLLAIELISRIREAAQVQLPLRNLFEAPNIAQLAAAIEASQSVQEKQPATAAKVIPRRSQSIEEQLDQMKHAAAEK